MATVHLISAVDFARESFAFAMDDGLGGGPWTITLSGYRCWVDLQTAKDFKNVAMTPLITALATEIQTQLNNAPSVRVFTVSYSSVTRKVTISADGTFSLTFTGIGDLATAAGRAAALMGFTANKSAASSYVGDVVVGYAIETGGGIEAKSRVSDDDEEEGLTIVARSDDGKKTYQVSRTGAAKTFDFMIQHQPKEKVFARHKTGTAAEKAAAFTYEQLWDHLRLHAAHFAVVDDSLASGQKTSVHKLREEGTSFREGATRFRVEDERDDSFHVRFLTYVFGRL